MEKKLIGLVFALVMIGISVIFLLTVLDTRPIETSISEIVSASESWLNKRVRVKGVMLGPLIYIPERIPPYNYLLEDNENATIKIGMLYSGETLGSAYVTIIGIVKVGRIQGLQEGDVVYYIEVEEVEVLDHEELAAYSYSCEGDIDQLITSGSYAVDSDWSTKVEWNAALVGDFHVDIMENFIVPSSCESLKWEFRVYHKNKGSLMPTPMEIFFLERFFMEVVVRLG